MLNKVIKLELAEFFVYGLGNEIEKELSMTNLSYCNLSLELYDTIYDNYNNLDDELKNDLN